MLPDMAANEGLATSPIRARRQGIVTGVVGVVGLSVGTLIVSSMFGGLSWLSLQALVPQLDTLVWAVVVALGLPYLGARDVRFAITAVALALALAAASAIVQFGGAGDVLFVVAAWKMLTLGCAALLGSIAGVLDVRRHERGALAPESMHAEPGARFEVTTAPEGKDRRLSIAIMVTLVAGSALMFALPLGLFQAYFSIWDAPDPPTLEEVSRYEWTAGLTIAAFALAVVLAIVRRRKGLIIASAVGLVLGLAAAFVFQIPTGRFMPAPAPVIHQDYPVCYGTTGDCPGG